METTEKRVLLEPGASVKVRFPGGQSSAKSAMSIVDDAGISVMFHNIGLAGFDRVTAENDGRIDAVVEQLPILKKRRSKLFVLCRLLIYTK